MPGQDYNPINDLKFHNSLNEIFKKQKNEIEKSEVRIAIMRIAKDCSFNEMGDGGGHTVVKVDKSRFYDMIIGYVNGL